MIKITGKNYIAGEKSSKGNNKYYTYNPKTKQKSNIKVTDATKKEINLAVKKAVDSFNKNRYISTKKLSNFLKETSNQIIKLDNQLLEVAKWETALSIQRLKNERERTCKQLEMFADYISTEEHLEKIIDKKIPKKIDIRRFLIPIGPVVIFPASNFPFAFGTCGGDTASALAAGCPVIIKTHPSHPQTSELFANAVYKSIEKTGLPNGFFSLIHGKNNEISNILVTNDNVEAIGFTGSLTAGRKLYDLASKRNKPIPVYAEMGSINPVFLTDKAIQNKKDKIAEMLTDSVTLGMGQFCTKPGVFFITEKSKDFIDIFIKKIKSRNPETMLNKKISTGLIMLVNDIKKDKKVKLLIGGNKIDKINSFENTVFLTNSKNYIKNKNLHHELFGPIALFVLCKDFSEFIDIAKKLEGQLTSTIHLDKSDISDVELLIKFLEKKVGRIIFNGVPTGVEVCHSMQHGGPYPATTAQHTTSVGMQAVKRFLRPIAYQNCPVDLLPIFLKK